MNILTTDFHTHILPGIDDGSQSVTDSIEMLRKEHYDGVNTIVLTPHFDPQQMYPDNFLKSRQAALEQLKKSWPAELKMPEFILGAEIMYCPGMSQWNQLDALTLGDSKYILIEMPFAKWSESIYKELNQICVERGLTPIIAHIERYLSRLNMRSVLKRLLQLPVLLQMNCEYLIDKRTQRTSLKLLAGQKIHLLGSDCHSPEWRKPVMGQAREILLANSDEKTLSFLADMQRIVLQR